MSARCMDDVWPHFDEAHSLSYTYLIHVYYHFHICQIVDNHWRVPEQMTYNYVHALTCYQFLLSLRSF